VSCRLCSSGFVRLRTHNLWCSTCSLPHALYVPLTELQPCVWPAHCPMLRVCRSCARVCRKEYRSFRRFVAAFHKDPTVKHLGLEDLLIQPVQRVPRYVMLIGDLFKKTKSHHADHTSLDQALAKLREVAAFINEQKRHSENVLRIYEIQESLHGKVGRALLPTPQRGCFSFPSCGQREVPSSSCVFSPLWLPVPWLTCSPLPALSLPLLLSQCWCGVWCLCLSQTLLAVTSFSFAHSCGSMLFSPSIFTYPLRMPPRVRPRYLCVFTHSLVHTHTHTLSLSH
jgi:RhoGEF domain